jgi:hypothetical protein
VTIKIRSTFTMKGFSGLVGRCVCDVLNLTKKVGLAECFREQRQQPQQQQGPTELATEIRMRAEIRAGEDADRDGGAWRAAKSGDADGRRARPSIPKLSDLCFSKTPVEPVALIHRKAAPPAHGVTTAW